MKHVVMIVSVFVGAAAPAFAQPFEIAPLVSVASGAAIDRRAEGIDDLSIRPNVNWGALVDYFFATHVGVEFLSTYESTSVAMKTAGDSVDLFKMKRANVHASVVYRFDGEVPASAPFLFAGFGATHFRSDGLQDETKPSWTAGAGIKWLLKPSIGVEARGAYVSTLLHDGDSTLCDPFGFCQSALRNVEIMAGVLFRF